MKVNVGTIGHIDHGKTTLTAALVRVLGDEMANGDVVTDTKAPIIGDYDECADAPAHPGRVKSSTRKAARKARMLAAQRRAFFGEPAPSKMP